MPIPRNLLVLSQKKLELFWANTPPAPINGTEPWVKPESVGAWLMFRLAIVVVARVDVPTTVKVPVKFAALEIVCPLIRPEVMVFEPNANAPLEVIAPEFIVPILDILRELSIICVPFNCSTVEAPTKLT